MKLLSMVPYDASVDSCPRPQKAQPQCTLWACSDVMSMQIHCDRCSDPVRGVDGGGGDGVWKSVPSIQFCCEPKTVLKILIVCLVTVSSRGEDLSKIERQNSAACTIFVFHAIIS